MTKDTNNLNDKQVQELTSSLYLINGLYERMTSERDHIASAASKIINADKQFQGHLVKLAEQGEKITLLIQQTLHKESENVARMITAKVYEEITEQSNKTLLALENAIRKAGERFNDYGDKAWLSSRWFLSFILVTAIVGGLCGGLLVRYCAGGITMDQTAQVKMGYKEFLATILPRLSEAEQEKLLTLLEKAAKPS